MLSANTRDAAITDKTTAAITPTTVTTTTINATSSTNISFKDSSESQEISASIDQQKNSSNYSQAMSSSASADATAPLPSQGGKYPAKTYPSATSSSLSDVVAAVDENDDDVDDDDDTRTNYGAGNHKRVDPVDKDSAAAQHEQPVHSKKSMNENTIMRVRIYQLIDESHWDDQGTGFCQVVYVESKDAICIVVHSELDGRLLMESPVLKEDVYQKQQDTLILWTEPDGRDMALSFQDSMGCSEVWENIGDVRRRLEYLESRSQNSDELLRSLADDYEEQSGAEVLAVEFPPLELSHLPQLSRMFSGLAESTAGRNILVKHILAERYIERLCEMFEMAEDLEMRAELLHIFNIMKAIVQTNDHGLFEMFLQDDFIIKICGIFEYDPEYRIVPPRKYRNFLSAGNRFQRVAELGPTMEQKIHQTFRAQYLKDVVLARIVDESQFSALSSIVMFNQMELLNGITADRTILSRIFDELRRPGTEMERKRLIVYFLQDFCNTAKTVQLTSRQAFFHQLASNGILQELPPFFADEDYAVRMAVTEILINILEHEPSLLRSFILAQTRHGARPLTETIIEQLVADESDSGMQLQYVEILRLLLDSPMPRMDMSGTAAAAAADNAGGVPKKEDSEFVNFLHFFYNENFSLLVKPLRQLERTASSDLSESQATLINLLLELLCFFIRAHTNRIKYYILGDDLLWRISQLMQSGSSNSITRKTTLKLSVVRLMRTLIAQKDEFFNRFIIKQNLLAPLMQMFDRNGSRYNLLNSMCLELFEFIRLENIKSLVKYLVEHFRSSFEAIDYLPCGRQMIYRFEQNAQPPAAATTTAITTTTTTTMMTTTEQETVEDGRQSVGSSGGRRVANGAPAQERVWSAVDRDEEAYFSQPDDSGNNEQQIIITGIKNNVDNNNNNNNNNSNSDNEVVGGESTQLDYDAFDREMMPTRRLGVDDDDDDDDFFSNRINSKQKHLKPLNSKRFEQRKIVFAPSIRLTQKQQQQQQGETTAESSTLPRKLQVEGKERGDDDDDDGDDSESFSPQSGTNSSSTIVTSSGASGIKRQSNQIASPDSSPLASNYTKRPRSPKRIALEDLEDNK